MTDNAFRKPKCILPILALVVILGIHFAIALITVPVDDLLGPGQCPTGSFCIETSYCTDEYYTTKTGLPFYCGPNQKIDSMICCITPTESTLDQPSRSRVYDPQDSEIPNSLDELVELTRKNRSANLDDDDEVEIQSFPFNTDSDEASSFEEEQLPASSAEVEAELDPIRDAEANKVDQESEKVEAENIADSINVKKDTMDSSPGLEKMLEGARPSFMQHTQENLAQPEVRAYKMPDRQFLKPLCTCEKGEKGDPGPKGEPGEPGKIIYIPVFVSADGYNPEQMPSHAYVPPGSVPLPLLQTNVNAQQFGQTHGQQTPQHPQPIIKTYNVPISPPAPSSNIPSPPFAAPPGPPSKIRRRSSGKLQENSLRPPRPFSSPIIDNLHARFTRNSGRAREEDAKSSPKRNLRSYSFH